MQIPAPLRAAVGLVATAADEARRLPDRALELPMMAVSTALQASVRAQQRYARLTARGDAVLRRGQPADEPPPWATFDDPLPPAEPGQSRFDAVDTDAADDLPGASAARSAQLFGELIGVDDAPTTPPAKAARKRTAKKPASPARRRTSAKPDAE